MHHMSIYYFNISEVHDSPILKIFIPSYLHLKIQYSHSQYHCDVHLPCKSHLMLNLYVSSNMCLVAFVISYFLIKSIYIHYTQKTKSSIIYKFVLLTSEVHLCQHHTLKHQSLHYHLLSMLSRNTCQLSAKIDCRSICSDTGLQRLDTIINVLRLPWKILVYRGRIPHYMYSPSPGRYWFIQAGYHTTCTSPPLEDTGLQRPDTKLHVLPWKILVHRGRIPHYMYFPSPRRYWFIQAGYHTTCTSPPLEDTGLQRLDTTLHVLPLPWKILVYTGRIPHYMYSSPLP